MTDRRLAVALGYDPGTDLAPHVLASAAGGLAARLRAIAEEHGIPLERDDDLAELLFQVPIKDEIPPELYPAVAEIFAFLLGLAAERRRQARGGEPSTGARR